MKQASSLNQHPVFHGKSFLQMIHGALLPLLPLQNKVSYKFCISAVTILDMKATGCMFTLDIMILTTFLFSDHQGYQIKLNTFISLSCTSCLCVEEPNGGPKLNIHSKGIGDYIHLILNLKISQILYR